MTFEDGLDLLPTVLGQLACETNGENILPLFRLCSVESCNAESLIRFDVEIIMLGELAGSWIFLTI